MGRRRQLERAWQITRRNWLWEAVRACVVGIVIYLALVSTPDHHRVADLVDAIGPAIIALVVAGLFFLGEFSVNYARAGDQLALEDERASHRTTRAALAETQRRLDDPDQPGVPAPDEPPVWDLVAAFHERTQIEVHRMVGPYLGKPVQITGIVNNVSTYGTDTVSLMMGGINGGPSGALSNCWFEAKQWEDKLAMLRKGDTVTVRGRLRNVDQSGPNLEDCELERS